MTVKNLLKHTLECDTEYVSKSLTDAHTRTTNLLTYNNEASFQSAIGLAYFYATAQYTIIKELPTGKGYADVVFIPFVPNLPARNIEPFFLYVSSIPCYLVQVSYGFNLLFLYDPDYISRIKQIFFIFYGKRDYSSQQRIILYSLAIF